MDLRYRKFSHKTQAWHGQHSCDAVSHENYEFLKSLGLKPRGDVFVQYNRPLGCIYNQTLGRNKHIQCREQQVAEKNICSDLDAQYKRAPDSISEKVMLEINSDIKLPKCLRLEVLTEGTELVVRAIKEVVYRGKSRYVLEFENLQSLYISNFWLEKELIESNVDFKYMFKIRVGDNKTTPNKV